LLYTAKCSIFSTNVYNKLQLKGDVMVKSIIEGQ